MSKDVWKCRGEELDEAVEVGRPGGWEERRGGIDEEEE
jgi:hypothetical protein